MNDRPIIFSTPMIQALGMRLKTQTRRLLNLSRAVGSPAIPEGHYRQLWYPGMVGRFGGEFPKYTRPAWQVAKLCTEECKTDAPGRVAHEPYDGVHATAWGALPFYPGLKLWVRETWRRSGSSKADPDEFYYLADYASSPEKLKLYREEKGPWMSPMLCPRKASRFILTVDEVRIQRLQEISIEDAIAEGVPDTWGEAVKLGVAHLKQGEASPGTNTPIGHFWDNRTRAQNYGVLWDTLHAKGDLWENNPWVLAVSFSVDGPRFTPNGDL